MELPKPYYENENGKLYHGNCLDIMPLLDPVDLVLTDPPYGLGNKWQGGRVKWTLHHGQMEWDNEKFQGIEKIIAYAKQSIIWGGHLYQLPTGRCWFVWYKKTNDRFTSGQAELAWSNIDKPIRVFSKSTICLAHNKVHPTQKPVELFEWCLKFTTGQIVLDPFFGSGTTAIACERLNRKWVGIEISEHYCEMAAKRIEKEREQLQLFPESPKTQIEKPKQIAIFKD